jgi:short subunit dehydrogenase-like uncharacterized protein
MVAKLMIYGAYGFTGQLLARRAIQTRDVVLGGRSSAKLSALAKQLGVEHRTIGLENTEHLRQALVGVRVLLNAAGPFALTAGRLLEACLQTGTHYLDVSGELEVFRALHARGRVARERGVLVLPGVGLLVMATDCLAAYVSRQLDAPVSLALAISRPQSFGPGSRRTMLRLIDERVRVRRDGWLVEVPVGSIERSFDLGQGEVRCSAINGAETFVSSLTTGISNITVYAPANAAERLLYRWGAAFAPLLRRPSARRVMNGLCDCFPSPMAGTGHRQAIVAVAEDAGGRRIARRLITPEPYEATVMMALAAVELVSRDAHQGGFYTPGQLCGPELLLSLPGVSLEALLPHAA